MILCGGKATRLSKLTNGVPKSLLKIGQLSILGHQLNALKGKIDDVVLLIGSHKNRDYFEKEISSLSGQLGMKFRIVEEETGLGTLGALKNAQSFLERKFLLIMGDVLFDEEVSRLFKYLNRGYNGVLFVRNTDHPQDSDLVSIDSNTGRIVEISKYPHSDAINYASSFGMTGIFAFKRSFLNSIQPNQKMDLTYYLSRMNCRAKSRIKPLMSLNGFLAVGTPKRFNEAETFLENRNQLKKTNLTILDRDGTLIKDSSKKAFVLRENRKLFEKLRIAEFGDLQTVNVIVSNQPAIAKGIKSLSQVEIENKVLVKLLKQHGIEIYGVYICPHHPRKGFPGEVIELKVHCHCRKPKPGLLVKAVNELEIWVGESRVIGDSARDFVLARVMGFSYQHPFFEFNWSEIRNWFNFLVLEVKFSRVFSWSSQNFKVEP